MKKKEVQIPVKVYLNEDSFFVEPKNQKEITSVSRSDEFLPEMSVSLQKSVVSDEGKEVVLQKRLLFMRVGVFVIAATVLITWAVGLTQSKFFDLKLSTTKSFDDFKKTLNDSFDNFTSTWQQYQPGNLLEATLSDSKDAKPAEKVDNPTLEKVDNANDLNKNNIFEIEP